MALVKDNEMKMWKYIKIIGFSLLLIIILISIVNISTGNRDSIFQKVNRQLFESEMITSNEISIKIFQGNTSDDSERKEVNEVYINELGYVEISQTSQIESSNYYLILRTGDKILQKLTVPMQKGGTKRLSIFRPLPVGEYSYEIQYSKDGSVIKKKDFKVINR